MSTDQEFFNAIELVGACKASLSCGCQVDSMWADWLYTRCKDYVNAYRDRMEREAASLTLVENQ